MYEKIEVLLEGLKEYEPWSVVRDEKARAIYRRAEHNGEEGKIFLIVYEASDPLRIEVGVGRDLSKLLAGKYESVSPSHAMDARAWIEVICSGQLSEQEVLDLVRASWERAGSTN